MAIALFNKHAKVYQEKYMNVDLYGDTLDFVCTAISKQAKVIDLACGPGNISRYLLDKCPDIKLQGIDLSPNMIELAKVNNPKAEFRVMDCRKIAGLSDRYDAVIAGFLFPYLSKDEVMGVIASSYDVLEDNGLLYISTMEDDYVKSGIQTSSSGEDSLYMYFHEDGYLTSSLQNVGFSIVLRDRKIYEGRDGNSVTDLILIAKKGEKSP